MYPSMFGVKEFAVDHCAAQVVAASNMDGVAHCDGGQAIFDNTDYYDDEEVEYEYWDTLETTFHEYQDVIDNQEDDFYYANDLLEISEECISAAAQNEPFGGRRLRRAHFSKFVEYWRVDTFFTPSLSVIQPWKLMHPSYGKEANIMPTWHDEKNKEKHRHVSFKLFVEFVHEDIHEPVEYELLHHLRRRCAAQAAARTSCGGGCPQLRGWVVDSGASYGVVSRVNLDKEELKALLLLMNL